MKKALLITALTVSVGIGFTSCTPSQSQKDQIIKDYFEQLAQKSKDSKLFKTAGGTNQLIQPPLGLDKVAFTVDAQGTKIDSVQANKQISKYLSLHNNVVKSYYFNSSVISKFIQQGATFIKVIISDSKDFVQNGGTESYSLIVVGIDASGNYVMLDGKDLNPADPTVKYVFNNVAPCPLACGDANTPMSMYDIIKNN